MSNFETSPSATSSRVLVVDDEPKNRELICDTLEAHGFETEEAGDGAQALASISRSAPDIVLLDVAMPGMDGLEVCRRLRSQKSTADLPVLMVTAHADRSDRLDGIKAGANDYLTKPVDLQDLVLRVRNTAAMKRLNDTVKDNLLRLQELERLRDGLTHMVIHDLRSPLSTITMALQLIGPAVAEQLGPDKKKFLDTAESGARLMSDMVASLLDVSRLEEGKMPLQRKPCDLAAIVDEVVEQLRLSATNRTLRFEPPEHSATAEADEELLRRVITNLTRNALKFTPKDGTVEIDISTQDGAIRVSVRDNGPGIAPEMHERIFEKFGQIADDHARKGSGLGLTFCKLAVEAHGGQIGVESQVNSGSTFWFTVPTAPVASHSTRSDSTVQESHA